MHRHCVLAIFAQLLRLILLVKKISTSLKAFTSRISGIFTASTSVYGSIIIDSKLDRFIKSMKSARILAPPNGLHEYVHGMYSNENIKLWTWSDKYDYGYYSDLAKFSPHPNCIFKYKINCLILNPDHSSSIMYSQWLKLNPEYFSQVRKTENYLIYFK